MRPFYQTEWQDIPFSSFTEMSNEKLADSAFYDAFYRAVFQKYFGYEALDPGWRRAKDEIADWLAAFCADGIRVLSVGCGLGYIEQRLWHEHGGRIDLHVQDYASESLRWLRQVMPANHIHDVGDRPNSISERNSYDLIYLSAVDYALPTNELIALLSAARKQLCTNGQIFMISASFLDDSFGKGFVSAAKDFVRWMLEQFGLYKRGQLWGWMRSRAEYRAIMLAAGMAEVTDGFVETPHQSTYWIKGIKGDGEPQV